MQKYFQPLPIRLCFSLENAIFEEMNKLVQFWKPFKNALHEQSIHNLHVHSDFIWHKLANPSGIGPSMRLCRPMHEGPSIHAHEMIMHSAIPLL